MQNNLQKFNFDISIIIINYNTFQLTNQCINSVYKYTKEINYEVILIDNGSTECDPDIFVQNFPNINLIKSKNNLGFSKGNNLGIEKATGKIILLLNSDTQLKENSIKTVFDYLVNHEKVGAASCRLIFPDGKYQSVCQRFPSIKYQLFELLRLHKLFTKRKAGRILLGSFFDYNENVTVDWIWGAFFMFRATIIQDLPEMKLNEDFFMYGEDIQWCWDINKLGYEIHYCSNAEIIHYMGGSSGNKNYLIEKNNSIFLKKNYFFIHRVFIKWLEFLLKISQ